MLGASVRPLPLLPCLPAAVPATAPRCCSRPSRAPAHHTHATCSLKTSGGALAVLTLDASGGTTEQRISIVGDQSRATLAGKSATSDLQIVS